MGRNKLKILVNMRIKKKLLPENIAVPLDKGGNFSEQFKSLKENQITYKESEVQYQIIHSLAATDLCWITHKMV